jgi:hypothetical protein
LNVPFEFPLASHPRRVQYRGMAGRKKMSPAEMRKFIHACRGQIKFNTGGKSFSEWWADYKREEKELEERKFQRLAALGKK